MRKSISILLCLSLLFGLSLNLNSQSAEEELDQKELTKQFIGNWVSDWGNETVTSWEINPVGNGYECSIYWEKEGQLTLTDKGIMGFTSDGLVIAAYVWSNEGLLTCDYGKFESKNKITLERYNSLQGQVVSIFEFEFIDPEKMKMVWKRWGAEESREEAQVTEHIFTKVR